MNRAVLMVRAADSPIWSMRAIRSSSSWGRSAHCLVMAGISRLVNARPRTHAPGLAMRRPRWAYQEETSRPLARRSAASSADTGISRLVPFERERDACFVSFRDLLAGQGGPLHATSFAPRPLCPSDGAGASKGPTSPHPGEGGWG